MIGLDAQPDGFHHGRRVSGFAMAIPVIDLFAGPGGLGEGFSSLRRDGSAVFRIALSIECDVHAHRTLRLRAFYRQFPDGQAPEEYYQYLAGLISWDDLSGRHPVQAERACAEAWNATLGDARFPPEIVDARIRRALGDARAWVLIGGPPCQAYSIAGRSRIIGGKGRAAYESDHRHFLYREYLRIIAEHEPAVFVMENVKGLLSARIGEKGTLDRILNDLRNPTRAVAAGARNDHRRGRSYRLASVGVPRYELFHGVDPEDFIVRAERFGIPQARHRLIILGIREDRPGIPRVLAPQPQVPLRDVLDDLPRLRSGLSKEADSFDAWRSVIQAIPKQRWVAGPKIDPAVRNGMVRFASKLDGPLTRGGEFIKGARRTVRQYADWYVDNRLSAVCNHSTRAHIRDDLERYFFAAVFGHVHARSPRLGDFPEELLPRHANVTDALQGANFDDRFRVQLAGRPATTITSHISKDGHYFIHYDPSQCRSMTVREAARAQTFPDNYFFDGPRTEQYRQVGNAVPPLLARQIAAIVADLFN